MQSDAILISAIVTAVITLMGGGLGALFWSRLDRIEAHMATREELAQLRDEFSRLREEVRFELGGMRSDLTQVALAVGARRPHASGN